MKIRKIILSAFILMALILGFIVYAFKPSKGDRYYLPEKYAGWICVSYNVEGALPLEVEDGFLVHKIPENGILETSSEPRLSPKTDEYFYYSGNKAHTAKGLKHGGGFSTQKNGQREFNSYFWVSSEDANEDYEKYVKGKNVICGPWKKQ